MDVELLPVTWWLSSDGCQLPGTSDRQVEERDEGMRERELTGCVCARTCLCVCVLYPVVPTGTGSVGLGGYLGHTQRSEVTMRSGVQ